RQQARQTRQLLCAQPRARIHPGRRTSGARRHRTRSGVLHQRRRTDQHVRVRAPGGDGVRATLADATGVRPAGARGDVAVAAAALPVRAPQATVGTPCGGTSLPRQLFLHRQGPPGTRLPAALHHPTGAAVVPAVLRRPVPPEEGRARDGLTTGSVDVSGQRYRCTGWWVAFSMRIDARSSNSVPSAISPRAAAISSPTIG